MNTLNGEDELVRDSYIFEWISFKYEIKSMNQTKLKI